MTHRALAEVHVRARGVLTQVVARHDHELLDGLVEHGELAARDPEERNRSLQDRLEQLVQLQFAG